jgi:class 3 adenylate cyclase
MGAELQLVVAHLRLEDEAFVLVPVHRDYTLLPRTTRLEVLDELRTIFRRERLQGHVVPIWFEDNGRIGFLADASLHRRVAAVTPQRLRANLNRVVLVPAVTAELQTVAGPLPELAEVTVRLRPTTRPGVPVTPSAPPLSPPSSPEVTPEPSPPSMMGYAAVPRPSAYASEGGRAARPTSGAFVVSRLPTSPSGGGFPGVGAPPSSPSDVGVAARHVTGSWAVPSPSPSPSPDVGFALRTSSSSGFAGVGVAFSPPPPPDVTFAAHSVTGTWALPASSSPPRAPSRELPRRIVTMVFTDIVGSTELKQRAGEHGAMELIRWHHATVRDVLALTGGGEEVSTAGDSFFLVFSSPSDAVRFALLLQARLRVGAGNGWYVHDRIGIHVGEVFLSDEVVAGKVRDFYGVQVDTCARVMSLGGADQILLTRFAAENAHPSLQGQPLPGLGALAWVHHGAYALKGVEGAVDIFEVGELGQAPLRSPSPDKRLPL